MSTRWNFEKQEELKGYLEVAHKVAKDYLSVHSETDSAIVYRISDDAAKEYSKNPSIINTQPIADYVISYIREMLKSSDFPTNISTVDKKSAHNPCDHRKLSKEKVAEIQEMIKQGVPYKTIAKKADVSPSSVERIKERMKNEEQKVEKVKVEKLEVAMCKPVEINSPKPQLDFSNIINIVACLAEYGINYFTFSLSVNGKEYMVSFSEVTNND